MNKSILIIDDKGKEADELRLVLKQAGYQVTGIAVTSATAKAITVNERPDIILLSADHSREINWLELAGFFRQRQTPFILLSFDISAKMLDTAGMVQPYGLLSRPLRGQDIIAAIAIANSRHEQELKFRNGLSKWLNELLLDTMERPGDEEQKLVQLIRTFQPFIHFDNIIINLDLNGGQSQSVYAFERIDLDKYRRKDHLSYIRNNDLNEDDLQRYRNKNIALSSIKLENGDDFLEGCKKYRFADKLREVYGIGSAMIVPVTEMPKLQASIGFYSTQTNAFTADQAELIKLAQPFLTRVLKAIRKNNEAVQLRHSLDWSIDQVRSPMYFKNIIGKSLKLLLVMDQITQVAPYDTTVLITGETGTGKESLVDAIHQISPRSHRPLIKINCAAIPESLLESELFGYERGAFTGAADKRIGLFEKANGGTILLDEIGEIPLELQSKLLRVLQEKEIQRIGGRVMISTDIRIIASTNRNLSAEVAAGRFRSDLFYRVNVFPIEIPPLRERKEDIPLLADHFLTMIANTHGTPRKTLSSEALLQLMVYDWPGNVRELQSHLERAALITSLREIREISLPERAVEGDDPADVAQELETFQEIERKHIMKVLKSCNGKINGKGGAAEILNLPPTSLNLKMKKLGISWQYTY